jgi:hypothetical protein
MILKYTILCYACCVCVLLAENEAKKKQPEIFQGDKADAKIREFMLTDWGRQTWQIEKKPPNGRSSDPPTWHLKGTTWEVRIIGPELLKENLNLDKLDPKLTYEFSGMPVSYDCAVITLYAMFGIQKLEEQKLDAKAEQAPANPLLTLPQELIGRHNGAMGQFGQATKDKPLSFGDDDITLGGIELKADGELIVPFALKGESFKDLSFKFHEMHVSGAAAVWLPLQDGNDRYSAFLSRYGSVFRVLVKQQREDGSVAAIQWLCAEPRKAEANDRQKVDPWIGNYSVYERSSDNIYSPSKRYQNKVTISRKDEYYTVSFAPDVKLQIVNERTLNAVDQSAHPRGVDLQVEDGKRVLVVSFCYQQIFLIQDEVPKTWKLAPE